MNKQSGKQVESVVDLNEYGKGILYPEDQPLFDDAVKASEVGAFRAAYVMIWLSCAEALKRRFYEAQKWDCQAGTIVGEIEFKEKQQKAIDSFLLEKAFEYGFITNSGKKVLEHIYQLRCLYGHPYEEEPSKEQIICAASAVVENVLSKPIKLKHKYCEQLLKSLLEDRNYLDDLESAVKVFTKETLKKIDEEIHGWLLDRCWGHLEKLYVDPSQFHFLRRSIWFSRAVITETSAVVFTHEEWHQKVAKFPNTMVSICGNSSIFPMIGINAQDSLVGTILEKASVRSLLLTNLEHLNECGHLTERQQDRFITFVAEAPMEILLKSGLSTKALYKRLIGAMKSYTWKDQNSAIDFIVNNGASQVGKLSSIEQENLGRNISQSGEGRALAADRFLLQLSQDASSWPTEFLDGIVLESVTNEDNRIRFKLRHLDKILSIVDKREKKSQEVIVSKLEKAVSEGIPRDTVTTEDFQTVIYAMGKFVWATSIIKCLREKKDLIETTY